MERRMWEEEGRERRGEMTKGKRLRKRRRMGKDEAKEEEGWGR